MNLRGTGLFQQTDDIRACRTSDDGVIDHYNPLAFYALRHCRELYIDTLPAHLLVGFYKGSADIIVADKAHSVGYAALAGISYRGVNSRVRHGDHYIGLDRMLFCQHFTGFHAGRVHLNAVNNTVRTGKVDIFKNAYSA